MRYKYNHRISIILLLLCILTYSTDSYCINITPEKQDTTELQEVVVERSNVTRTADVDSYLITKSLRENCHNAGELIGRIEGVERDPLTKAIKYLGSGNVIILLDSVAKDEDYIKRLNPKRFERISITSNPTGMYEKYDAVINLKTKPDYTGYEGGIDTGVEIYTGNRNGTGQALRRLNPSGDFTYTNGKFNISASVKYIRAKSGHSFYYDKEYLFNSYKETSIEAPIESPTQRTLFNQIACEVTADYKINENNSVSVLWDITPSFTHTDMVNEYNYGFGDKTSGTATAFTNNDIKDNLSNVVSLYYRGKYNKLWNLNVVASYDTYSHDNYYELNKTSGYNFENNRRCDLKYFWGGADLTRVTANKKWNFFFSSYFNNVKYTDTRLHTESVLSKTSRFWNYTDLYVTFMPNEKISVRMNVGMQITTERAGENSVDYARPKAGVALSYRATNNLWARLNYWLYPAMPNLSMTEDYGYFKDSLVFFTGNPNLKPALINQISLTAGLAKGLIINVSYRNTHNAFVNITSLGYGLRPDGKNDYFAQESYQNGNIQKLDISASYKINFIKNWHIEVSAGTSSVFAEKDNFKNSKTLPWCSGGFDYTIPSLQTTFVFNYFLYNGLLDVTPQVCAYDISDRFALFVTKSFCKGALQLLAGYVLPLHIYNRDVKGTMVSDALTYRQWGDNKDRLNNSFQFSVTYRFGGGQKIKKYYYDKQQLAL